MCVRAHTHTRTHTHTHTHTHTNTHRVRETNQIKEALTNICLMTLRDTQREVDQ